MTVESTKYKRRVCKDIEGGSRNLSIALRGVYLYISFGRRGGLMVRVRTLAEDIVLCSWARYFTITVPLSTQVYK